MVDPEFLEPIALLFGIAGVGKEIEHIDNKGVLLNQLVGIGDGEQLESLIDKGADVKIKDGDGNTAQAIDAHSDHIDWADILIAAGANVNMIKYQGVKNFTLVARMQNSSSVLRATDESSMF